MHVGDWVVLKKPQKPWDFYKIAQEPYECEDILVRMQGRDESEWLLRSNIEKVTAFHVVRALAALYEEQAKLSYIMVNMQIITQGFK